MSVCMWLPTLYPLMTFSCLTVTWRSQTLEYRKQSGIHSAVSVFLLNSVVCVADLEKRLLPEVFSVLLCELIHLRSKKLPFLTRTKTADTSRAPSVRLENRCLVSSRALAPQKVMAVGSALCYFFLIPFFIHSLFSDFSHVYFSTPTLFWKEVHWEECLSGGQEIGSFKDEHLEEDEVSVIVTKEGRQTGQA